MSFSCLRNSISVIEQENECISLGKNEKLWFMVGSAARGERVKVTGQQERF